MVTHITINVVRDLFHVLIRIMIVVTSHTRHVLELVVYGEKFVEAVDMVMYVVMTVMAIVILVIMTAEQDI